LSELGGLEPPTAWVRTRDAGPTLQRPQGARSPQPVLDHYLFAGNTSGDSAALILGGPSEQLTVGVGACDAARTSTPSRAPRGKTVCPPGVEGDGARRGRYWTRSSAEMRSIWNPQPAETGWNGDIPRIDLFGPVRHNPAV
jgi:hypothetical protein